MHAALIRPLPVLAGIGFAALAWAYPTGAPPGHAGAAGGADCGSCHFGTLDDASPPVLELTGLADSVPAGSRQILSFRLSHPAMRTAGIQLSLRTGDTGARTSGLHADGAGTTEEEGVIYLNHLQPFPARADGFVSIPVQWMVPDQSGTVIINAAMLAANDDESPLGDSVVTIERVVDIKAGINNR